jgi:hypothetical protein
VVTEPRDNKVLKTRKRKATTKSDQNIEPPTKIKSEPVTVFMIPPEPEMGSSITPAEFSVMAPSHSYPAPPMTEEETMEKVRQALLSANPRVVKAIAILLGVD